MDEEYLRINFNPPPDNILKQKQEDQNPLIHIKEIIYRFSDSRTLNNTLRIIKEIRFIFY